jgi:mono/diheme cytochrome c family protein
MTNWKRGILLTSVLALGLYGAMQAKGQTEGVNTGKKHTQSAKATQGGSASEGEKRFEQNCGRCHTPPEDLSPREARAVLRQMRVRALLSAEDERLILKYIAP